MSDIKRSSEVSSEIIQLLPKEIQINPRYNVRPFSSLHTDAEDRRIEELAAAIEQVGQMDPVIITPERILIAGHRRRKAVIVINDRRTRNAAPLLRLRCSIDAAGGDYRQKAIISNLHRREASPMDFAYLICQTRKEHAWEGWDGTRKLSEYLHVNHATIMSHERLMSAEKELQNRIHEGVISMQTGLDLIKHLPSAEERQHVLERARTIQAEERTEKLMTDFHTGKKSARETCAAIQTQVSAPKVRIERPAVIKAIREHHKVTRATSSTPVVPKKLSLSRAELIGSIEQFDNEDYSVEAREFARYWTHLYAEGRGNPEELRAKFRAIALSLPVLSKKPITRNLAAS